ncbi:AAA family ATPase [Psychromonas algicola]|uniref:AAA family ATPase n=1 Tax=Psychromonas algicola TaxID=2555642 RepID=UPI001ABBD27F|nr:ATP-binding protein [Psychromonas sp. RZ5]
MSIQETLKQQSDKLIRVVLFGPESTGKTTLSRQLAAHYNTVWAPEFLREFAQEKWDKHQKVCEPKDIIRIAQGQIRLENEASKSAHKILICDTDLLETKVYAEAYFEGFELPELNQAITNNHYDLYCLTYIDTPWEADDLRDRPELREQMFTQFENALITHKKNYLLLKGDKETRLKNAIRYIDELLTEK